MLFIDSRHVIEIVIEISSLHFLTYFRDLRYNHIKEIPINAFVGMTKLASLFLGENQITAIDSGVFKGLSSLRYLYLNENRIKTIAADAFVDLTKLERL